MKVRFENRWDGEEDEKVYEIEFFKTSSELRVKVKSNFYNDPAPPAPAGYMMGLWDYEVVELFLSGLLRTINITSSTRTPLIHKHNLINLS